MLCHMYIAFMDSLALDLTLSQQCQEALNPVASVSPPYPFHSNMMVFPSTPRFDSPLLPMNFIAPSLCDPLIVGIINHCPLSENTNLGSICRFPACMSNCPFVYDPLLSGFPIAQVSKLPEMSKQTRKRIIHARIHARYFTKFPAKNKST
ncbi:hypothetical protein DSO57_1003688 [Entomophthora muscae]|uniref:Uncharacterized protein n=1 Tax=Entomophthora muscae TaxID=34485 RepID=A0ACC2U6T7_9FUNG|nr:hypothetical protein DSO57_1003688 [Entomophthora muscae]